MILLLINQDLTFINIGGWVWLLDGMIGLQ